jgi:hypothetical protein
VFPVNAASGYAVVMRRATSLTLVVMTGTAMVLGLSGCGTSDECEEARAAGRPDAEQVCARSGSRSHWYSRGSSGGGRSWSSSARGGFGGSAHSVGS